MILDESKSLVTQINQNFIIRLKYKSDKKSKLIGAGKYLKKLGEEIAIKHFEVAFSSKTDKTTFKLRRGLTIVFHSK